jgi:hypothetical protein
LQLEAVARCGLHCDTYEHLSQIGGKELVEYPSELVVIEVLGFYALGDQMFGSLTLEKLLNAWCEIGSPPQ